MSPPCASSPRSLTLWFYCGRRPSSTFLPTTVPLPGQSPQHEPLYPYIADCHSQQPTEFTLIATSSDTSSPPTSTPNKEKARRPASIKLTIRVPGSMGTQDAGTPTSPRTLYRRRIGILHSRIDLRASWHRRENGCISSSSKASPTSKRPRPVPAVALH